MGAPFSIRGLAARAARAFLREGKRSAHEGAGGTYHRSIDAAAGGRRGGAFGTFAALNSEVSAAAHLTAQRAEYLAVNDAYLCNGVGNHVAYGAGAGGRVSPVGVSRQVRRALVRHFDKWAARADHAGRTDFYGLQAIVWRYVFVHGEALILLHDEPEGLQLQVIPPDHLDGSRTEIHDDGRMTVQGVAFDARGRRAGYWIHPQRPHSQFAEYSSSVFFSAENVLHIVHPIGAGQVRGLSHLAAAVLPANELNQLRDALLVSAKVAAMHAAFITSPDEIGSSPFDDTSGNVTWEPGAVSFLPNGNDIKFNSPEQLKDAPALVRMNLQAIAAALGMPEHLLSGDLSNANYSSLRAGLLPFRARIEQMQYGTFVPQFLRPVWERWLATEIMAGRLDEVPVDTAADWIMPRPQHVDPAKDIAAVKEALALGLTSRTQAINELGWNADDIDEEIAADREREAELGLSFTAAGETGNAS